MTNAMEIRRANRRTFFKVFVEMAAQHGNPEIIDQMRIMVRDLGVEGTMKQCPFAKIPGITNKQLDGIRLAFEYMLFEEPAERKE